MATEAMISKDNLVCICKLQWKEWRWVDWL